MSESGPPDPGETVVECEVDPDSDEPNYVVLQTIADIEQVDVTTLPPMYQRIDHILEELFSDPPESAAQVEITFSYHGYRITISQDGLVLLRKLEGKADEPAS